MKEIIIGAGIMLLFGVITGVILAASSAPAPAPNPAFLDNI